MPPATLPFSIEEYAMRLARVRSAMDARGIDILFAQDPSNIAWLTGYDGWSFYTHQGVVITNSGDPVWWGRFMDSRGAERTVWMDHDRIVPYADGYVMATDKHPMETLAALIADLGGSGARIGVEMENYYYSAKAHEVLTKALPEATFVDATALVNWQRGVKSPAEIAFMRRAARISEAMVDGYLSRIRPGLPKNELVAEIQRDAIRGADGHWGDYAAIVPMLPSGIDATAAHLTWDDRPFEKDEVTFFEISGCYRRYHAPFCRSVYLGVLPDDLKRAEEALVEGLEAGLDAARAGGVAGDVARAYHTALARHGIERTGRCGYPIGLSYPPDWGERTISFREEDENELKPGMTFHLMTSLWLDTYGIEITEPILITEDGPPECLCDRPREIFVKS